MKNFENINVLVNGCQNINSTLSNYSTVEIKCNNMYDGRNIITLNMINKLNTKYLIKWNFILDEDIIVPKNCIIEFDGGSISNGTLIGQDTMLIYNTSIDKILKNVNLQGTFLYRNGGINADEEDITQESGVLKFKNKDYNPQNYSGLGRIYLRNNSVLDSKNTTMWFFMKGVDKIVYLLYFYKGKLYNFYNSITHKGLVLSNNIIKETVNYNINNLPNNARENSLVYTISNNDYLIELPDKEFVTGKTLNQTEMFEFDSTYNEGRIRTNRNILTLNMINKENTIYHIQYDYVLDENITIPKGCILKFEGGSVSNDEGNYIIVGLQTIIDHNLKIEDIIKVQLSGTWEDSRYYTDEKDNLDGMGKIYIKLEEDLSELFEYDNTIYVIKNNINLSNSSIEIPENCILKFEGGSLSNGTIVGNNTKIEAPLTKIFGENSFIDGTWNVLEAYPEWFGTNDTDCSIAIGKMFSLKAKSYIFSKDIYPISLPIHIKNSCELKLYNDTKIIVNNDSKILNYLILVDDISENTNIITGGILDCNSKVKSGIICNSSVRINNVKIYNPIECGILCNETDEYRQVNIEKVNIYNSENGNKIGIIIDRPNCYVDNCYICDFLIGIKISEGTKLSRVNCISSKISDWKNWNVAFDVYTKEKVILSECTANSIRTLLRTNVNADVDLLECNHFMNGSLMENDYTLEEIAVNEQPLSVYKANGVSSIKIFLGNYQFNVDYTVLDFDKNDTVVGINIDSKHGVIKVSDNKTSIPNVINGATFYDSETLLKYSLDNDKNLIKVNDLELKEYYSLNGTWGDNAYSKTILKYDGMIYVNNELNKITYWDKYYHDYDGNPTSISRYGTSLERHNINPNDKVLLNKGFTWFDSDLNENLIWNGFKWVSNGFTANSNKGNNKPVCRFTKIKGHTYERPTNGKQIYVGFTFYDIDYDKYIIAEAIDVESGHIFWIDEIDYASGRTPHKRGINLFPDERKNTPSIDSSNILRKGTTEERPTAEQVYEQLYKEFEYFDTDFNWPFYVVNVEKIEKLDGKFEYSIIWAPRDYIQDVLTLDDYGFLYFDTDLNIPLYALIYSKKINLEDNRPEQNTEEGNNEETDPTISDPTISDPNDNPGIDNNSDEGQNGTFYVGVDSSELNEGTEQIDEWTEDNPKILDLSTIISSTTMYFVVPKNVDIHIINTTNNEEVDLVLYKETNIEGHDIYKATLEKSVYHLYFNSALLILSDKGLIAWANSTGEIVEWPVIYYITNARIQNSTVLPKANTNFFIEIIADEGYVLPTNINISIDGKILNLETDYEYEISSLNSGTGSINIKGFEDKGVTGLVIVECGAIKV